jgi:hypothetical protein
MATLAELAKGFSEFKAQFAEFQGRFNAVLKFLTWCGATLAALAIAIVGFLYAQGQTLTKLETSLGDLKERLQYQSDKLNASINGVAQSNTNLAARAQSQASDLKEVLKALALPPKELTLRIAFTRQDYVVRPEGDSLVVAAPLPVIISLYDRASIRVQSLDLPPEIATYQASASLEHKGAVCELTIRSTQADQIRQFLFSTGISGSFLVSIK